MLAMPDIAFQQCIGADCAARFDIGQILFSCPECGSLLDVRYDWSRTEVPKSLSLFGSRRGSSSGNAEARLNASGVWRFRELLPFSPLDDMVTAGEGQTQLQPADALAGELGVNAGRLFLQYEGFNPSGSFKDNGMAAAFTMARRLGCTRVACASTGNTSASLAMFARHTKTKSGAPMEAIVFVGGGKIALGKLAQALDYGATTIQIAGDFDACMQIAEQTADRLGLYLMNSVNPFRLEGQKTIMYRVLEGLNWEVPDWIIVPGGNLGNGSAFGKAFAELRELGLIDRIPRLAIINAAGANTLCQLVNEHSVRYNGGRVDTNRIEGYYKKMNAEGTRAKTVASAIEIGRPVNLIKALRSLEVMDGVVEQVNDAEILDGKALVGKYGYGCEPASGASVAGLRKLIDEKMIAPSDRVVCILTGHALKDPNATIDYHGGARQEHARFANPPTSCVADFDAVARLIGGAR